MAHSGISWTLKLRQTIVLFITHCICYGHCYPTGYNLPAFTQDSCNTLVWDGPSERWGVKHVIGKCAEGTILWRPPRGALRITLLLPTSDYVLACFSLATEHTKAKISIEDKETPHGIRDLATTDHLPSQATPEICIKGIGNITLYIESHMDRKAETVGKVLLTYDLEALDKKHFQDDLQDCRPCTDEELLSAYCSKDFVVKGEIEDVKSNYDEGETHIYIKISRLHRQVSRVFVRRYLPVGQLQDGSLATTSPVKHSRLTGVLVSSDKCGIAKGTGHFLFMGKIRLGRAILQCAPRAEEFDKLWRIAVKNGTNPCDL